jgi:hypothetical protein
MRTVLLRRLLSIAIMALLLAPHTTLARTASLVAAQPGDEPAMSAEEAAIRDVILRSNAQQEAAIAAEDSSLMRDTATDRYYREMERINDGLLDAGVTRVELVAIEWGPIEIAGPVAEATTYETWAVTTRRGRTVEPPERNVYRLVLENGVWKVDANEHPDQPPPLPPGRPLQT